jgi:hypothetical protein
MPETPVFPSAFAPAPTPRVSSAPDAAREIPAFASDCALAPTPGAAGVPPASDRFHAAEPRPAAAAAMSGHAAGTPRGDDARALARWIGAHATPLTAVDVAVKSVEGLTLFLVSSTELPGDLAMEAARPLAARAPWEVDQMTFRGPDAALILTPLGPLAHGGSVLGWAVRPDGNLAMLEVLSLRAAAENGARATPSGAGGRAAAGERQGADLVDTEPPGRVRRAAASLGALGPVTAVAFRDAAAARDVYLFLPAGTDARPVGRFASELDDAVRATTAWGLGLRTAVLRCGKRRLIVRLEGGERSSILVAGGETDRPGLAHRQVESVALTLDTR